MIKNSLFLGGISNLQLFVIIGEPLPEVTWFKGKKHLKKSKRVKSDVNEKTREYTLEISNATAEDSGEYTVCIVNEVGMI